MPKGYWIHHCELPARAQDRLNYLDASLYARLKYSGVSLVGFGRRKVVEGRARSPVVLHQFPDYAAALACYRSSEYQAARSFSRATSADDLIIVEGYAGDQPMLPAALPAAARDKGYWIGHVDVPDPDGRDPSIAAIASFRRFGGRFLVRGGRREVVEGHVPGCTVILEFPSYRAALDCHRSPEYQAAKRLRDRNDETVLIIIEGYAWRPHYSRGGWRPP